MIKRLRKSLEPRKIKYFAVGEYGDPSKTIVRFGRSYTTRGDRPHYHMIIYGLRPELDDTFELYRAWLNPETGYSMGNINIGLAERESIQYVAGYVVDKLNGEKGKEEYEEKGREPLFAIMSKGLGKDYALEDAERLRENVSYTVRGIKKALPRYYVKKLEIDPQKLRDIAERTERERVVKKTGINATEIDLYKYHSGQFKEYYKSDTKEQIQKSRNARELLNRKSKK